MADLLIRLYDLPPLAPALDALAPAGVTVRRALAHERHVVVDWVRAGFSPGWASECEVAFARVPLACFVAVESAGPAAAAGAGAAASPPQALVGFACYEATCRGFFGPEGVRTDRRGKGLGRALVLSALHAMRAEGHAYAFVGWAADAAFYRRVVGAAEIPGSAPGIYPPPLRG